MEVVLNSISFILLVRLCGRDLRGHIRSACLQMILNKFLWCQLKQTSSMLVQLKA